MTMRKRTQATMNLIGAIAFIFMAGCGQGGSDPAPEPRLSSPPVVIPPPPPPPPAPVSVTLAFVGTFAGSGTASGTFSYEQAAAPDGTNVRSLSPNVTYPLTAWSFTLDGTGTIMPSSTFENGVPGHTAEFCLGICQFSGPQMILVSLKNDAGLLLQLSFDLLDPTPFIDPPFDITQWGAMRQSVYRMPCPVCVPFAIFSGGTLTQLPSPLQKNDAMNTQEERIAYFIQ
jgi:hypothetical protein